MKSLKSIKNWTLTKSLKNNNFSFKRNYVLRFVPSLLLTNAFKSISSWKNYKPTPLLKLDKLQKNLKLNNVFYKDESKRFHLKSFKALGGAYAVEKISKGKIGKFINDNSLLNQIWIMDPKKKVSDILKENSTNEEIKIVDFIRYKVGEGV